MKRSITATLLLAGLWLGPASAHERDSCSPAGMAGQWGHSFTGTFLTATGAAPVAVVGMSTVDAEGVVSGTQTSSLGGKVSRDKIKGTATLNSDCSGTLTVEILDESGNVLRKAVWAIVVVDNEREFRGIMTSLLLEPAHTSVPAVVTLSARKMFPGSGQHK